MKCADCGKDFKGPGYIDDDGVIVCGDCGWDDSEGAPAGGKE